MLVHPAASASLPAAARAFGALFKGPPPRLTMIDWPALFDTLSARISAARSDEHAAWHAMPAEDAAAGLRAKLEMEFTFEHGLTPEQLDRLLAPIDTLPAAEEQLQALLRLDLALQVLADMLHTNDPALPEELRP